MKETIILALVEFQTQLKFMHWQTFGDSKHRTYGSLYDMLGDKIDSFVETMMGKYGRPVFPDTFNLQFSELTAIDEDQFIDSIAEFLISLTDELDPRTDSDLLNIRDEMLGGINQGKYLLTLKY